MHVVLAGASGLIGSELGTSLREDGHSVLTLVRREAHGREESRWDPGRGRVDPEVLVGADAVVCLSGAGVGSHRWTASYKQLIRDSRVQSVQTLARALAAGAEGGRSAPTLVAASAVGYYGDTGAEVVTEAHAAGDTFLAGVCRQWEAAAEPARAAGLRVVHLRTGLVLAPQADLVKRLEPIVRFGLGGKLGSGRQYWPWISLPDEIDAIRYLLTHEIGGPVNLTGPTPVTQADFVTTMGRVLHRPAAVPTPGFALRAALGEFAGEILIGQRAVPATLTGAGYSFRHADLESALRWTLRR